MKLWKIGLLLIIATAFFACDNGNGTTDPCANGHDFTGNWVTDATHHWKVCTRANCDEIGLKDEHDFADGECTICGAPDPNYTPPVDISGMEAPAIKTAIETALAAGDVTVTGTLAGVTSPLTLAIPAGRTVNWEADYTGENVVWLQGEGDFVLASVGSITSSVNGNVISIAGTGRVFVRGTVTNTDNGAGIGGWSGGTIIVDGGTITSINNSAIQVHGDNGTKVIIQSGAVTTTGDRAAISLSGNSKLAVLGGTVSATVSTNGTVMASGTSTVYVAGNYIADGGIWQWSTASGYYAAGFAGKFRTGEADRNFTPGTDLFEGSPPDSWWD